MAKTVGKIIGQLHSAELKREESIVKRSSVLSQTYQTGSVTVSTVGTQNPVVSDTRKIHTDHIGQLVLAHDDGRQRSVNVNASRVQAKEGDRVEETYLTLNGVNHYLEFRNLDTGQSQRFQGGRALYKLTKPKLSRLSLACLFVIFAGILAILNLRFDITRGDELLAYGTGWFIGLLVLRVVLNEFRQRVALSEALTEAMHKSRNDNDPINEVHVKYRRLSAVLLSPFAGLAKPAVYLVGGATILGIGVLGYFWTGVYLGYQDATDMLSQKKPEYEQLMKRTGAYSVFQLPNDATDMQREMWDAFYAKQVYGDGLLDVTLTLRNAAKAIAFIEADFDEDLIKNDKRGEGTLARRGLYMVLKSMEDKTFVMGLSELYYLRPTPFFDKVVKGENSIFYTEVHNDMPRERVTFMSEAAQAWFDKSFADLNQEQTAMIFVALMKSKLDSYFSKELSYMRATSLPRLMYSEYLCKIEAIEYVSRNLDAFDARQKVSSYRSLGATERGQFMGMIKGVIEQENLNILTPKNIDKVCRDLQL